MIDITNKEVQGRIRRGSLYLGRDDSNKLLFVVVIRPQRPFQLVDSELHVGVCIYMWLIDSNIDSRIIEEGCLLGDDEVLVS